MSNTKKRTASVSVGPFDDLLSEGEVEKQSRSSTHEDVKTKSSILKKQEKQKKAADESASADDHNDEEPLIDSNDKKGDDNDITTIKRKTKGKTATSKKTSGHTKKSKSSKSPLSTKDDNDDTDKEEADDEDNEDKEGSNKSSHDSEDNDDDDDDEDNEKEEDTKKKLNKKKKTTTKTSSAGSSTNKRSGGGGRKKAGDDDEVKKAVTFDETSAKPKKKKSSKGSATTTSSSSTSSTAKTKSRRKTTNSSSGLNVDQVLEIGDGVPRSPNDILLNHYPLLYEVASVSSHHDTTNNTLTKTKKQSNHQVMNHINMDDDDDERMVPQLPVITIPIITSSSESYTLSFFTVESGYYFIKCLRLGEIELAKRVLESRNLEVIRSFESDAPFLDAIQRRENEHNRAEIQRQLQRKRLEAKQNSKPQKALKEFETQFVTKPLPPRQSAQDFMKRFTTSITTSPEMMSSLRLVIDRVVAGDDDDDKEHEKKKKQVGNEEKKTVDQHDKDDTNQEQAHNEDITKHTNEIDKKDTSTSSKTTSISSSSSSTSLSKSNIDRDDLCYFPSPSHVSNDIRALLGPQRTLKQIRADFAAMKQKYWNIIYQQRVMKELVRLRMDQNEEFNATLLGINNPIVIREKTPTKYGPMLSTILAEVRAEFQQHPDTIHDQDEITNRSRLNQLLSSLQKDGTSGSDEPSNGAVAGNKKHKSSDGYIQTTLV